MTESQDRARRIHLLEGSAVKTRRHQIQGPVSQELHLPSALELSDVDRSTWEEFWWRMLGEYESIREDLEIAA